MAQLVERLVRNEETSGSNPLSSTKKIRMANAIRVFYFRNHSFNAYLPHYFLHISYKYGGCRPRRIPLKLV